jgi:integrative and conjugative element protein (TIGR02256 family)
VQEPVVWIADSAVTAMTAEGDRCHPYETGGMLLGWVNDDRKEVVVVMVLGPGPLAEHEHVRFRPDAEWQQQHLDDVYKCTDGRVTFLGDWHVHPNGGFGMSRRDRKTMSHIAATPDARCPHPVMALLARTPDDGYRLGAWAWSPSVLPFHAGHATPLEVRDWSPSPKEAFWNRGTG